MSREWTVGGVVALLEQWFAPELAQPWDRVGLVVGDPAHRVARIGLALDPAPATVAEATQWGADLLITHHPLFLHGTSFLPESTPKGAMVADLVRGECALFAAHTNADVAVGGVADALAALLGVGDAVPLHVTGADRAGRPVGVGRCGGVPPTHVQAFAERVAASLPAGPHGLFVGGDAQAPVRRVAVIPGAGEDFLDDARSAGADAVVTADLRHHRAGEYLQAGRPALIAPSHWASEQPWLATLATRLRAGLGAGVQVHESRIITEPWYAHLLTTGGTQ